jgi:DNA-binding transcriptional regulator YiaG
MPLIGVTPKNWTKENTPKRVRALLDREAMTQQTLATILGVAVSTVARWCTKDNANVPDLRSRMAMGRIIYKTEGGGRI